MKFQITEGMTVFLRPYGNRARGWNGEPVRGTITKIDRKYFYVKCDNRAWEERFDRRTFEHDDGDSNGGYTIYQSRKSFEQAMESEKMLHAIRSYFNCWAGPKPSYEALKKIHTILALEGLIQKEENEP